MVTTEVAVHQVRNIMDLYKEKPVLGHGQLRGRGSIYYPTSFSHIVCECHDMSLEVQRRIKISLGKLQAASAGKWGTISEEGDQ